MSKEVVKKVEGAVVTYKPAPVRDFIVKSQENLGEIEVYEADEHDGQGLEDIKEKERRLPIVRILQANSPQCAPVESGGMGARPGSIFNSATNQVFDGKKGIYALFTNRAFEYIEYIKRNDNGGGGGFVRTREDIDPVVTRLLKEQGEFKKLLHVVEGEPHEIVQTNSLSGIFSTVPTYFESFRGTIPFQSTQIKKAGSIVDRSDNLKYVTRKDGVVAPRKPALWRHVWHLTTHYEKKGDLGWYGWVVKLAAQDGEGGELHYTESAIDPKSQLYQDCVVLHNEIVGGDVAPDFETDAKKGGDLAEETTSTVVKGDIPF